MKPRGWLKPGQVVRDNATAQVGTIVTVLTPAPGRAGAGRLCTVMIAGDDLHVYLARELTPVR